MLSALRIALWSLIGILAGCALWNPPYQPAPPPPAGNALVYFYRASLISGHVWDTTFTVDGKRVVELNDKEYSWVHLPAGTHQIAAKAHRGKALQVTQTLEAGKTYYVEFYQEIVSKNRVRNVVEIVPTHTGAERVKTFTYESASH